MDETGLELTDEIKRTVLSNYKYVPPKQFALSQTIAVYNTINNLVCQMSVDNKLELLLDRQHDKLLDFEDKLDEKYDYRVDRLRKDKFLKEDDFLGLVDKATKVESEKLKELNVMYDKTFKRIRFYSCGDWDSYLEDMGAKQLVSLIKSYLLDVYEVYLVKHLYGDKQRLNRLVVQDHLNIYYKFQVSFDLDPSVVNQSDEEILGYQLREGNDYYLSNRCVDTFRQNKREIKASEINRIKKRVISIIKENSNHNAMVLNKCIMDLLQIDETFKNNLINQYQITVQNK